MRRQIIILGLLLCLSHLIHAQAKKNEEAVFIGSIEKAMIKDDALNAQSFQSYILNQVKEDCDFNVLSSSKKVLYSFTVDAQGQVKDIKPPKAIDEKLNASIIKCIAATSNMWQPAVKNGKTVADKVKLYL